MEENKKSKTGLIILIIIILLLILFAVWYFLLRDKGETNNGNSNNNNQQQEEQPKETKGYQYDYREGVLTPIVDENGIPKQTDFVIDGIILIGNRHGYDNITDTEAVIAKLVSEGYKKEGINSSFYLNEHIEMYLDTKYNGSASNVKVLITPHKTVEELEKMSISELTTLAEEKGAVLDYQTPDEENYKYIGDPYVNGDYPEGKYDILFTYKGKLAYFINVNLTKEPTE
jgi:hypothetical protein